MSIFYIKNEQIKEERAIILGDDVKHIRDVLRHKLGDEIKICDENGIKYITNIINITKEGIDLKIINKCDDTSEPNINITLFQGLPKADKLEMIIQKCTELGITEIIPIITDRVIVKIEERNVDKKLERWNRIALEAAKQSGRQRVPRVKTPINIKNLVENIEKYDILLLPYECEKDVTIKNVLRNMNKEIKNIAIIIGPEGGFSDNDIDLLNNDKIKKVSLGPRILRTETAGFATLAMVLYELDM